MDMRFCFSCAMPLTAETTSQYCQHCTGPDGKLLPREAVKTGITQWMKSWQGDVDDATVTKRADSYMNAMPAWAE
jgi:hypothetical protein